MTKLKYNDPEYIAIINEYNDYDAKCKYYYKKYQEHLREIEKLKIRAEDCFANAVFYDNHKKETIQKRFAYDRRHK